MRVSVICILLVIVSAACVSKQTGIIAVEAQTEDSCSQILKMISDFDLDPEPFIKTLCKDTCSEQKLNYTDKWECSEKDRLLCYCGETPEIEVVSSS